MNKYLMSEKVELLKSYKDFGLAKIKFADGIELVVDKKALTEEPDLTNTISIGLLTKTEVL